MSSLLRALLIGSAVAIAAMIVFQPTAIRRMGRRARQIAYIYIAVILASALLRVLDLYPGF